MDSLIGVLAASVTTFAATNIDDVVILTLFFARRVPTRRVVLGQYLGFAAIIVVCMVCLWAALAIPHQWIRLMGLLPLGIGIKALFEANGTEQQSLSSKSYTIPSIALVTLANGADNVGVYVPFFLVSRAHLWLVLIVYTFLIAIWCLVSQWIGKRPAVLRAVNKWGHWAVPLVFVGLGIYILIS